jgi:hypothetical protein
MTFKEQIEKYLSGLPSKWKDELVQILCLIKEQKQVPDCDLVKSCETVTSLSPFTVEGSVISIQFKDENGTTVTRSFDTNDIINAALDGLDPQCLATQVQWDSLTFAQRIQLLIDAQCACCEGGFAPRIFNTESIDPLPCAGNVYLSIDELQIGDGVGVGIGDTLAETADALNEAYEDFATFVVSEDGIETTLLVDGYTGIYLQFDLSCE